MAKPQKVWAVVTKRGRILPDSIHPTYRQTTWFLSEFHEDRGAKVRQVEVRLPPPSRERKV